MAESNDGSALPQATVMPRRRGRVSVVWIVPILAAVVALGIAVQRILSEGPTISIVFKAAEGIEAGKTFVKFKDINIGQVSSVELSEDYTKVTVKAKIAKSAAGLLVEDAKFWVVEPRISLSGVSGLGTLLSGNYIGFEPGKSKTRQHDFKGLDTPPVVTGERAGRQFVLRAAALRSLGVGAPLYYRSLAAGQVLSYELAADGRSIDVKVFVNAPYDKYVVADTRFWNASGIDLSLGADGVQVRTESLVALIAGGIAFETPAAGDAAPPVAADQVFTLYADQATAMKQPETLAQRYVLYFNEPLRGLAVGAPVTVMGLPGGNVVDVGLDLDPATAKIRGRVEIVAYPERLITHLRSQQLKTGEAMVDHAKQRLAMVRRVVEQGGLRAQLRTGNLLTGQLYVAFDVFPHAPKVSIDWNRNPIELPVMPGVLPQIEDKLMSILAKIDAVPFAQIGGDVRTAIATFDRLIKDADVAVQKFNTDAMPEIKPALEAFKNASTSAAKALNDADASLLAPGAPAVQDLRGALVEFTRAARSLRVLLDYLEQNPSALIRGKTEENR